LDQVEKKLLESKDKLRNKQRELEILIKDMESLGSQLEDIRIRINKGKKEYSKIKQKYDDQLEKIEASCKEIQEKKEQLESKVDKNLLNKYKTLKSSHATAIAVIEQDRCGGCNMSLASLVIQKVKEQNAVVECENCGRILYAGSREATNL